MVSISPRLLLSFHKGNAVVAPMFARSASSSRAIVHRSKGARRGPITRLMSPGDLGEQLKPFVFLDLFEADHIQGRGFAPPF